MDCRVAALLAMTGLRLLEPTGRYGAVTERLSVIATCLQSEALWIAASL